MSPNRLPETADSKCPTPQSGWHRFVAKRFGILMACSLLAWPLAAEIPQLDSMITNAMLLDSYPRLAFLTFTNVIAIFFAMSILRLLNHRNPGHGIFQAAIGDGAAPWGKRRLRCVTLIAVATPLLLSLQFDSEFEAPDYPMLKQVPVPFYCLACIAVSAAAAVAFLMGLGVVKSYLFGSQSNSANYFPFEAIDAKGFSILTRAVDWTASKLRWIGFEAADIQLALYLLMLAMGHKLLLPWIEGDEYLLSSAPSAVVLLLWLLGMTCSGAAYVLDRTKIPVTLSIIAILTVLFAFSGSTRPFRSSPTSVAMNQALETGDASDADLQWAAIKNRMQRLGDLHSNPKGKTLVIVTCPGGGIHAAAWSACVLDQLSKEYVEFKDSVCVISGVSGGSVGTLMFVGNEYEDELLERKVFKTAFPSNEEVVAKLKATSPALELATRSSLEAIAFGTTVDDLYGMVGLSSTDRGERLERHFAGRLAPGLQGKTLRDWGARATEGSVPIVVFNATDAASGRRVLFDSIPTPVRKSTIGLKARPLNYRELLGGEQSSQDVLPTTAARISASFPYISPFTNPDQPSPLGRTVALCDGGYVDNEGIVTAVTWIEYLLRYKFDELNSKESDGRSTFDRILLLRIEPALSRENEVGSEGGNPLAYFRWLVGPVETMMNVRSTSQVERGHLEADLAQIYFDLQGKATTSEEFATLKTAALAQQNERQRNTPILRKLEAAQKARQDWSEGLKDFETRFKGSERSWKSNMQKTPSQKDLSDETDSHATDLKSLVIVESIPFFDSNQVIPLNWKLSKREKLGYLYSWDRTDDINETLRPTLDRYFTRCDQGTGPQSSNP